MKDHLEISRKLALAIGWKPEQIRLTYEFGVQVCTAAPISCYTSIPWWRGFDYRDWNVIGPIAERYRCFPRGGSDGAWWTKVNGTSFPSDTPQHAIALAVIAEKGVK